MFDHKETLFHVASQLARRLANQLREALEPFGLHPAQFTALSEIAGREGLTQAELVTRLELEQPGVARTLGGLEAETAGAAGYDGDLARQIELRPVIHALPP